MFGVGLAIDTLLTAAEAGAADQILPDLGSSPLFAGIKLSRGWGSDQRAASA
jgi:hypothetical protein